MKFSFFRNGSKDVWPVKEITFPELVEYFTQNVVIKNEVEAVRSLTEQGEIEQARDKKNKLPYVTPTGCYTQRKDKHIKPESYNWIAPIDIDLKDNEGVNMTELFKQIKETPSVLFAIRSPSGNGIKGLVKTKPKSYKYQYHYRVCRDVIYPHLEQLWGCKLDQKQGVLSQPFFVTHDPFAYVNEKATPLILDFTLIEEKITSNVQVTPSGMKLSERLSIYTERIRTRELGKYNYFGKIALFVGGLFKGGYFQESEQDIINALVKASNANTHVIDYDAAEKWLRVSFENGKMQPITEEVLRERSEIDRILYNLDKLGRYQRRPAPEVFSDDEEEEPATPFPLEVLPKDMVNFIKICRQTLNFNEDATACAMMSAIASVVGNKYKLRVKNGWDAPLIFWFAIMGNPGTTKSHPLNVAYKPLRKIDEINKEAYDIQMREYNALLVSFKEKKIDELPDKPKFKQIIMNDYTIEALFQVHEYNKRGVSLFRDELKGFIEDMNKYRKGSDEQFWLESFNNSSYTINRVTKDPVLLSNICINIVGGFQPEVFQEVAKKFKGNGFVDRFLFTETIKNAEPLNDLEINSGWFDWWNSILENADNYAYYNSGIDSQLLTIEPDAFKRLMMYDKDVCAIQNDPATDNATRSYLAKIKTYLPRFALLMWTLDVMIDSKPYVTTVNLDQMQRAITLAEYFKKIGLRVLTDVEITRDIEQATHGKSAAEKIAELWHKGFKKSEIIKATGKSKTYVYNVIKEIG